MTDDRCFETPGYVNRYKEYVNRYKGQQSHMCKLILMMVAEFQTPRKYGFQLRDAASYALVAGAFVDAIFNHDP
jgi:hypothetical protein